MIPFTEQARWYAEYHQNDKTLYAHMAGIPLIILAIMILLGFVHLLVPGVFEINLAEVATAVLIIYYFRLNWRLAIPVTVLLIILLFIANFISSAGPTPFSLWAFIIILVIGCALHETGHFIEGKRPAFTTDLWLALGAPLFLTAETIFMMGWMEELQVEIHGKEKKRVSAGKK